MFAKKNIFVFALGLLALAVSGPANVHGQTSSSHTVSIGIAPITVMSVSGDPMPLHIEKPSKKKRSSLQEQTTFYNLTTNIENVFIQAEISEPMPEGTELWLSLGSQLGNSHGKIQLTGLGSVSFVSNIKRGLERGQPLSYEFVATDAASDIPLQSRTVTLTLVDRQNGSAQRLSQTVLFSTSAPISDGSAGR